MNSLCVANVNIFYKCMLGFGIFEKRKKTVFGKCQILSINPDGSGNPKIFFLGLKRTAGAKSNKLANVVFLNKNK